MAERSWWTSSRHAERDPSNLAVFASTLGALQLQELRQYADDRTKFDERLKRSQQLKDAFDQYVVPLATNDAERARLLRPARRETTDLLRSSDSRSSFC